MKLLEFKAKQILSREGMPVPQGRIAGSEEELDEALYALGLEGGVLKAQVYSGGRGEAGGVRFFNSPEEAHRIFGEMIGSRLSTRQSRLRSQEVSLVLVEEKIAVQREVYISLAFDHTDTAYTFRACGRGGIEIEDLVASGRTPVLKKILPPAEVFPEALAKDAALFLGLAPDARFLALIQGLYRAFISRDCLLLEVNPLAITRNGRFALLDAKIEIDDNALFRQQDLAGDRWGDLTPHEALARQYGMTYYALAGNIGCIVNGAGLAMATLDLIKQMGGSPANFLDVGGAASPEALRKAFEIVFAEPGVSAVLVNIFGGIVPCDKIAQALAGFVRAEAVSVPIVVRLAGARAEKGCSAIGEMGAGISVITAENPEEAVRKAVAAACKNPMTA